MTLKKIIFYISAIIIIGLAGYYFYSRYNKIENKTVEYFKGTSDTLFIPGLIKRTFSQETFKGKFRIRKNDSTIIKDTASSGINSLSIDVHELNADSIELNFDFKYFNGIISQIDTVKILRVDTVKITRIEEKKVSVYSSFWVGVSVGVASVLMIIMIR